MKIYKPSLAQISDIIPLWEAQYKFHNDLDSEYYVANSKELTATFRIYVEEAITKDNPMILIAEVDEKIVAFITYEIEENDYMDTNITKYGVIIEMFVAEEYRKQGIATALIEKVEEYFKLQDLSHVEIQLSSFNTQAMNLYLGKGYTNRQTFVFKNITGK